MLKNKQDKGPTSSYQFPIPDREPTISIAMCTFNGAKYIGEQLESIAAQSCPPTELVICDDCSSDGTMALLERFAAVVPFQVRLFRNETNLGSNQNFEKAIALCQGDVIVLADQDDVWMPHKLESTLNAFRSHPTAVGMFSDATLVDEYGVPMGHTMWAALRFSPSQHTAHSHEIFSPAILLARNVITGATMAFRSSLRTLIGSIPPGFVHDYWIALTLALQGDIVMIRDPLICYRQHKGQQIGAPQIAHRHKSNSEQRRTNRIIRWQAKHNHMTLMHQALTRLIDIDSTTASQGPAFLQFSIRYRAHLLFRLKLPPRLRQRIWPIIKELINGNYHLGRKPFKCALQDMAVSPPYLMSV